VSITEPSTVSTLSDYADELLAVSFAALEMTTAGAPERSYVSPALPTFDCCPMLTVVVDSLTEGSTSPTSPTEITARRADFGSIILAGYQIWAIRCAPVIDNGHLPSPFEIAASALQVQEDGWALWNGIRRAHRHGEIFDRCIGVHFDEGVAIREQGGCVGWMFRIRAMIPGIPDA